MADASVRPCPWFSTATIKSKARLLIVTDNIANVSSHPGAVGMVSSCLNRLAVVGVVDKSSRRLNGRRRIAYKINRDAPGVAELLRALALEISRCRNFDSNFRETRLAYLSLHNAWRQAVNNILSEVAALNETLNNAAIAHRQAADIAQREVAAAARRQAAQAQVDNTNSLNTIYIKRRQQALREIANA